MGSIISFCVTLFFTFFPRSKIGALLEDMLTLRALRNFLFVQHSDTVTYFESRKIILSRIITLSPITGTLSRLSSIMLEVPYSL